jgi:hypothetical protein
MSPREIEIHDPAMMRSLVYDMGVEDPEAILARLGLPAVSEEGARMEQQASERRKMRVMAALPVFLRQSAVIANVMAHEHAKTTDESFTSEELLPIMAAYQAVSLSTIVSVLAYFLEVEVLKIATDEPEEEDE